MNMYKLVAKDGLSGRFFRFALIAILSFAMCITGLSSSFYAFAEDASVSKEAKEKEVAATSESNDGSGNEKEAAASEEASSKETALAEKAEPVIEKAEPATEIAEPASEKTEPAPKETEPVSEDVVSADNEDNSQNIEVTSQADETSQNVSVQEPATESQAEQAETKELTTETEKSAPNKTVARKTALMSSAAAPAESGEARIGNKTYASVQEAIEAAADGDIVELIKDVAIKTTIEIIGKSITVSDDGNARVIRNDDGTSAPLFTVRKGAELTLNGSSVENLKLQGGTSTSARSSATALLVEGIANVQKVLIDGGVIEKGHNTGAVTVKSGGQLNMSDGVIENTTIRNGDYGTAAVVIQEGAHFDMRGGAIRDNKNYTYGRNHGGGVVLSAWNTEQSTMNLSDGIISNNEAYYGGGIYMTGSSKLIMTGGSVDGNKARDIGGGICVGGVWARKDSKDTFVPNDEMIMNGGNITNNTARLGGGLYVNTDRAYLNAGYIENNYASGHGGGVYLSQYPEVLHVNKAVITENTARVIGGGIWSCPTGDVEFEVTDGVAIYSNNAAQAGDDLVMQGSGWFFSETTLTLPDRMLGGGAVEWYKDSSTYAGPLGSGRSNVPRFDPENPGSAVHLKGYTGAAALKVVTTEDAINRANEEATLFIRYNNAARGGGIGTNGGVTLAKTGTKDWKLVAEKKWEDIEGTDDKEVKVFLKIGGQILDSITLNKDNEWKGEFNGLPDPSSLTDENITIVEGEMVEDENGNLVFKETSQYSVRYERVVMADDSVIYVLVTNSPLPPEEPEEEETVTEEATEVEETVEDKNVVEDDSDEVKSVYKTPEKTEEAVIKSADSREVKTVKQVKAAKSSGVPTGDSSKVFVYIIALMIAAASAAGVVYRRRKEQ